MIAALLVLGLGCAPEPEQHLMWRDSWELLGILEGGRALDASVSIGNTGLLRGQGRLRMELWEPKDAPVRFSQHTGPLAVNHAPDAGRATVGINGLALDEQAWSFRVADDNVNALVQLTPLSAAQPQETWGDGPWQVTARAPIGEISGWVTAGKRGGLIRGRGLLLHRSGHAVPAPPRLGVYVMHERLSLIVDMHGPQGLAWATLDGEPLDTEGVTVDFPARGPVTVSLPSADTTITLRRRKQRGTIDPFEHLLAAEAWIAAPLIGQPLRRLQLSQATLAQGERTLRAPALLVEVRDAAQLTAAQ